MKWTGMLVVSLRGGNTYFGLAQGVLGKMSLFSPSGLHAKK